MSSVRNSSPEMLFPLPGEVCTQFVRCGKSGCRCRSGERHGPYYYRIWREGTRVQKAYVRREELAQVQAACVAYRVYQAHLRALSLNRLESTRRINRELRLARRLIK